MPQVWSATQINGHLSGSGTATVTYTGTSGTISAVYAATGVTAGKYYWEERITVVTAGDLLNGNIGFGVGNTSTTTGDNQNLGDGLDSVGIYLGSAGADGSFWVNGTQSVVYALGFTVADGDVFGFALDLTNNTLWFRDVTQNSGWFGSAPAGNPAANTNGFSLVQSGFTITAQPVVPGASLDGNGDTLVGYFSPASWAGAAPAGFVGMGSATEVWSATQINSHLTGGGTTTVDYTVDAGGLSVNVFAGAGVSTGKYYWEAKLSVISGSPFHTDGFGLGNTSSSVVDQAYLGLGFDSVAIYFIGAGENVTWFVGNSDISSFATGFTPVSGDVFGFAVDLTNKTMWFRIITQGSGWFGVSGSGDPETNTNGFSLAQPSFTITSSPVVPGATLFNVGDQVVGFFSPASWTGAVPIGFVGFDSGATPISGSFVGHGALTANRTPVARRGTSRYGGSGSFTVKAATSQPSATAATYSGTGSITAVSFIPLKSNQLTAGFSGVGTLSVPNSIIWAIDPTKYAGAGNFSANATVPGQKTSLDAAFLGTGSIAASASLSGRVDVSAAFSAAGSLSLSRLTVLGKISAAYRGRGALVAAVTASSGTPTLSTFIVDELGDQIVDELGNFLVSEFQPSAPTQLKAGFAASGSLAASPRLLARGFVSYAGAGSFAASLTLPPGGVGGIARYAGAGSFSATATVRSIVVTGEASFAGSGSLAARLVANLSSRARFAGTGAFSTGLNIPAVLARCFGANNGIFFPPAIDDAPRFRPATTSDAARAGTPLSFMKDVQLRFVAAANTARGLCATTDVAVALATIADAPTTSVVVAET